MAKRGSTEIVSIYWFFVIGVALVAIAMMVMVNSSRKYDVREAESDILSEKAMRCLIPQGYYLNESFLSDKKSNEDFEKDCLFFGIGQEYYLLVNIYKFESCEKGICKEDGLIKSFSLGNPSLKDMGILSSQVYQPKLSLASKKSVYVIRKSDSQRLVVHIIGVINKMKENAKV